MRLRFMSALMGVLIAAAGTSGAAEARVEKVDASARQYGSVTRSYMGKNFKNSAPRYARTKSARRVAYKSGKKYRTAYRSARGGKKVAKRSFTRYARSGGGGGSSRSCLTTAARGLLNRIESNFGPVSIVSTCRPGAVIAGSGKPSKHRNGQAIDFDAGGRKGAIVSWLIKNHHSGGTMTYRDMNHIHVDIGGRFVSLGANSRRG